METLKPTRQHFSKLGLMYLLGSLIIIGIQYLEYFIINRYFPNILNNSTAHFLILMLTMIFMPKGLFPTIQNKLANRKHKKSEEQA